MTGRERGEEKDSKKKLGHSARVVPMGKNRSPWRYHLTSRGKTRKEVGKRDWERGELSKKKVRFVVAFGGRNISFASKRANSEGTGGEGPK